MADGWVEENDEKRRFVSLNGLPGGCREKIPLVKRLQMEVPDDEECLQLELVKRVDWFLLPEAFVCQRQYVPIDVAMKGCRGS